MSSPHPPHLLTSSEAAARLGVSLETLYSYVSRRLVTPVAHPADSRRSLFEAADVNRLAEQVRRRSRRAVATSTLDCGEPVLNSAITRIDNGRFYYRGRDAVGLAESATLEDAAALLWQCPPLSQEGEWFDQAWPESDGTGPYGWCIAAAARLAHVCPWPSPPETVRLEAARLLRGIVLAAVKAAAPVNAPAGPIHAWIAKTWGLALIRRARICSGGPSSSARIMN
ncbi:MAG TPA: citrate synthase [Acetobacteraceae bacterium]|nr:citrate synthase [Acetobacteraceae bacterium]